MQTPPPQPSDPAGPVTVRLARPADRPGIQALFAQVFGQARGDGAYRWKFGALACPGGVADCGGAIVGFYGVMPWQIEIAAHCAQVLQVCDVAIAPEWRGTRGLGLFRDLAHTVIAAAMHPETAALFGRPQTLFGFPSPEHARLGRRAQQYSLGEDLHDVHIHPARSPLRVRQEPAPRDLAGLTRLCAGPLARRGPPPRGTVMGRKTPDVLWHRYGETEHAHEFWAGRGLWPGQPRGLAILRNHGSHSELMDIIAAPDGIVPMARALACACAARGQRLTGWMTQSLCHSFAPHEIGPRVATISISKVWPGPLQDSSLRPLFFGGEVEFR